MAREQAEYEKMAKRIERLEESNAFNSKALKLLIEYFELSQDALSMTRRGHTPDWGKVQAIADAIEDEFDLESLKDLS